ncbi:hypothetical protein T492DRAFT_889651, partial [Pavlovales sp. CCMP2436]
MPQRCASSPGLVLAQLRGPWALVCWRASESALYFGRDTLCMQNEGGADVKSAVKGEGGGGGAVCLRVHMVGPERPQLPHAIQAAIQLRSHDGRVLKLRLTNVDGAALYNIELRCADGWGAGVVELPCKHMVTIVGARAEPNIMNLPPWRLVLDARAPADALVVAEYEGKRIEVRREGVQNLDLFGGGPSDGAGGGRPSGTPAPRYAYTPCAELARPIFLPTGKESRERNLYGIVADYAPAAKTKGTDMMSWIRVVDETCTSSDEGLQLNLFKGHGYVPHVGAVVRVHRVLMQSRPRGGDSDVSLFASNTSAARGSLGTTTSVHCLAIDERIN